MAPLRYAAKFDPFLSLDCAPTLSTLAQSKERKGSNSAIWQPCLRDWLDVRNSCGGWDAVDLAKNTVVFGQILSGVEYIHSQVSL